ncbi:MAG: FHA domain-containing protein [Limisphaerales bacterium]|jgi:hypothetical protein
MGVSLVSRFFMIRLAKHTDGMMEGVYDFPLRSFPVTLGRALSCDLRLEEPGVADHHARIRSVAQDGLWLSSCEVGEVAVNGALIEDVRLKEGDWIQVGEAKLEFSFLPTVQHTFRLREWSIWAAIGALTLAQVLAVHFLLP